MEIDNNNNQDSDPDDPTLELEPLSEAACNMQADATPAEPDAIAETREIGEMCFETSAAVSDNVASEIQKLRAELKFRTDMDSILRHRNDQLREKCDRLAEQVSSLSKTNEALSNALERSRQRENPELTDDPGDPETRSAAGGQEAGQPGLGGVRQTAPTRSPAPRMPPRTGVQPCLVLLGTDGVDSETWVLDDGIATIGSSPECNIRIQSEFISRHHAQLIKKNKRSVLEDLNSTNGTYINSRRINKRALRGGDLVTIGKHQLQYRERSGHLVLSEPGKVGSGVQSGVTRANRSV